jgi:hypothetical protein
MCESSSVSPSFSSESSCRRKLVYRDVVFVRRLFKYDDIVLQFWCEDQVARAAGGRGTFIGGFVAHALVGLCFEAGGEGAVSSCSAEPKTPTSSSTSSEMSYASSQYSMSLINRATGQPL